MAGDKSLKTERGRYTNASLEKGLTVLRAIAMADRPIGFSETARRVGLDYSTAYRLMMTLERLGFIERNADSTGFAVGPAALPIGLAYHRSSNLVAAAQPEMTRLMRTVNETVNLAVLDGDAMLLLVSVEGPHLLATRTRVGQRFPIHCSASGRVMLASMEQSERNQLIDSLELTAETPYTITDRDELRCHVAKIERRGYAINREEHAIGLMAVSVPIRIRGGHAIATLDIAVPSARVPDQQHLLQVSQDLRAAADIIANRLVME